jgi:electron transport complex protein RnfD
MSVSVPRIQLRTSPHIRRAPAVDQIMRNVVYALLPLCGLSVYLFGLSALALIGVCTAAAVGTERLFCWMAERPSSTGDWSATITGMLLALTLPPGFPLWMAALAACFGIGIGKALFGGLGFNVMNPALVGRAFAQASFPVAITGWTPPLLEGRFLELIPTSLTLPFTRPAELGPWIKEVAVDGFSGATPLALQKFEHLTTAPADLFLGLTAGSAGETSALLILACGAYLVARRMMDWRVPAAMLGAAYLTSWAFHLADAQHYPDPLFTLLSGGLMLGAVFMATDMVASPVTPLGVWIYGAFMGIVTVIIRLFGGLPEGVMYAILLGNAVSPLIESLTPPRPYGHRRIRQRTP